MNGKSFHIRLPICRRKLVRSEEHTSELQSHSDLVCRLLLEKNSFHGTNAPVWTAGKLGQALGLEGDGSWVEGGNDFNPNRNDRFSCGVRGRLQGDVVTKLS